MIFRRLIPFIFICCGLYNNHSMHNNALHAASSWQAAENAARLSATDTPTAISDLLNILLDDPELYVAHYNLGSLLLHNGDKELHIEGLPDSDPLILAAEYLEKASASPLSELAARARHNLALARFQQGRLEDALREASLAVDAFPKNQGYVQTRNELRRTYLYRRDEARRKAEEEARRLRINTSPLPDAFVGRTYTHQLTALGGTGSDQRWSLVSETDEKTGEIHIKNLPETLTLSDSGVLHGIANDTSAGQHTLHFVLQDSAAEPVKGAVPLRIWPRAKIITEQLPEAIINQSYQVMLECEGLPQPQWFIDGLPDGLSIKNTTGARILIEGSATQLGEYPLNITVKDSKHDLISVAELRIVVSDSFAPDTSNIPAATAWAAYQYTLGVRGPTQTYTFMSDGSGGLAIDAHGAIAGKPEKAGKIELPLTIEAASKTGTSGLSKRSFVIEISVNSPPVINEEEKVELYIGQSLNRQLKHQGGTAPLQWSLEEGLLPDGVRLDKDGVIRGVASGPEDAEVSIALNDRWGARTQKKITLHFKAADPKEQGKDKQEEKEDGEKEDKSEDGEDGEEGEKGEDGEDSEDGKEGDKGEDGKEGEKDDTQQSQKEQEQQAAELEAAEEQAEKLNKASAQKWLDDLPEEDKKALLYQMLKDGAPANDGQDPW